VPDHSAEDGERLFSAIKEEGRVYQPVLVDPADNVIEGAHRLVYAKKAGLPLSAVPITVVDDVNTKEAGRRLTRMLNLARRHLNAQQRREAARAALAESPDKSDRQIAEEVGVSPSTVAARREEMEQEGAIAEPEKVSDKRGRKQKKRKAKKPKAEANGAAPKAPNPTMDNEGKEIPESLRDVWGDDWIADSVRMIDQWREMISAPAKVIFQGVKSKAKYFPFVRGSDAYDNITAALEKLELAREALAAGEPTALCPACEGKRKVDGPDGKVVCEKCRGAGLMPGWHLQDLRERGEVAAK
jgi:ParB-like chromosome segregation protein Spo0J